MVVSNTLANHRCLSENYENIPHGFDCEGYRIKNHIPVHSLIIQTGLFFRGGYPCECTREDRPEKTYKSIGLFQGGSECAGISVSPGERGAGTIAKISLQRGFRIVLPAVSTLKTAPYLI
jgi:hypothetical protein